MQNRLLQVLFALSSLILSKAEDVMGSGHSCVTSSPAGDGQTRVTFLREDAAGVSSLYLTLWSEDSRLVSCEVNGNRLAVERYSTLCDSRGDRSEEISRKFNVSVVTAPDAHCARVPTGAPKFSRRAGSDGTEGTTRRKRALTLPGTLWCGKGTEAVKYDQLGMFEDADRCCREHDHCLHIIPAFTVNYGVFNPNFYTVSHCDCDQRFRQCLLDVNDTISSMVGYSFFNILKIPCFELKQQKRCTKMYWFGLCKVAKEAPYAIFKSSLPFTNTSDVTSNNNFTISGEHQITTVSPRKSTKSKSRCGSRDPPRGDTFHRRRTKGKGCEKHRKLSTVAPSQTTPVLRAHTTTPSSGVLMSSKKRSGKRKRTRNGPLAHPTQKSPVPLQVTAKSRLQMSSTTQSTTPLTKRRKHLPTAITAVIKNTKSQKKVQRRSRCCESRMPWRDDTFWPLCEICLEQETTSQMTTVTAATTKNRPPIKVTIPRNLRLKKTIEKSKQDSMRILWNITTSATQSTTKLKIAASLHEDGTPQKQKDSCVAGNNMSQQPMSSTIAQGAHTGRGERKQNKELFDLTDNVSLCGNLKHLDECKYQIPPLEKKYDLHNMESKTTYHCNCTSRLAMQIKSLKQASILPKLLNDFVSQYCFKLSKEKTCHRKKSCAGGFTKASDLLQALKKIEEKDAAGVQNAGSDRKRGIPVRLYKRCLRLEREADIMAQLT